MSEQQHNAIRVDPLFERFLELWTRQIQLASDATNKALGSFDGRSDPHAWRRHWFDTLGQSMDAYLRSPPFLRMMKDLIDALVQAPRGTDESSRTDRALLAERLDEIKRALRSQLEPTERRLATLGRDADDQCTAQGWERMLDVLRGPPGAKGVTPYGVVYQEGALNVLRYAPDTVRFAEPVLICYALVNRPYILDLRADRSVVRQLLDRGFDVYLIDWGVPSDADRGQRLYDYICRFMRKIVDLVCQLSSTPRLNLLGYCMGGTLSTMFTALFPERVRNLILMATPIDFADDAGLLNLWAREDYFDVDKLIDTYGNCPGDFLRYSFQLMKPVQNFVEKYVTLCAKLDDVAFLDNFFAMERWANDSIPVAGETFREYVKLLYQQNLLVKGEISLGGVPVKLDAIVCPLLLLVAEQDHLVPPSSTLTLRQYVRSAEVKSMSINAGHIGLAVSSKAHHQLWPDAANWIAGHSSERR
jgi:polyhydroxyalkanoate synthase